MSFEDRYHEIEAIDKALGSPSLNYKVVHVTGTNGKGSVCLNIAKGIEQSGKKVGLFTSPHFSSYHERISINGENISEDDVQRITAKHAKVFDGLIFFNLMMFIALMYFKEKNVDYAVIEVGIGGLYDPTNIVQPEISVITSIGLDHQNMLGNSLNSVAYNKAGIIKQGAPVVLGVNARHEECFKKASKVGSFVHKITIKHEDFMEENLALANLTLQVLGFNTLNNYFSLPARFEIHGNKIFDMAHNPAGIKALQKKMDLRFENKDIILIFNMMKDKDVQSNIIELKKISKNLYLFPHDNKRLLTAMDVKKYGIQEYQGEKGDIYLCCGSIYFLEAARNKFTSLVKQ